MDRVLALGILGTSSREKIAVLVLSAGVPVLSASVLGARVPSAGAGARQQTGSVSGTITTNAKGLAPVRVTIDQKVCGTELPDHAIAVDAQGRLANAVVTLIGVKRASIDGTIMNEKCEFGPRVQVVRPNSSVRTSSKDPVLHTTNAQTLNGRTLFNVALPIAGINITKAIGGAGIVRLSCNTHPWMRGWVMVTDDAASVTGADGRFTIDQLPPGRYDLRVWHETIRGAALKITVEAGKPTNLQIELK